MVERRTAEFQCGNKRPHETRREAREHLAFVRKKNTAAERYTVYLCPHCGFYHVGKRPKK